MKKKKIILKLILIGSVGHQQHIIPFILSLSAFLMKKKKK